MNNRTFRVLFAGTSSYKTNVFPKPGSYSMAKKATKRRAWTAEQVRTLKTMARKKKHAFAYRQNAEAHRRRNAAKGV